MLKHGLLFIMMSFVHLSVSKADTPPSCTNLKIRHYFDGLKWHRQTTSLLIKGDTLVAIDSPQKYEACSQVNLEHLAITPGLIDAHTHIFIRDTDYGNDFSAIALKNAKMSIPARLTMAKENARDLLYSGFTSIRDLGNSGYFLDAKIKQEELANPNSPLPRVFISGPGLALNKGQLPENTKKSIADKEYRNISPTIKDSEIDQILTEYKKHHVDTLKIYADNDPRDGEMPLELLKRLVAAAKKAGLPVAVHASTLRSAKNTAQAAAHSLEHGFEVNAPLLQSLTQQRNFFVPTGIDLETCQKMQVHNHDPLYKSCPKYVQDFAGRLTIARSAKTMIVFGSDMYMVMKKKDRGINSLAILFSYAEGGMTPSETLQSATSTAAKLLQRSDLGVLQVGAKADIIGFDGDPEKDIRALKRVSFVMKNGHIFCRSESSCKK